MLTAQNLGNLAPDEIAAHRALTLTITSFDSSAATQGSEQPIPWSKLVDGLSCPMPRGSEAELRQIRPSTSEGGRRGGPMDLAHGVLGIHTAGTLSLDAAAQRLEHEAIQAFVWTLAGHTEGKPRWAILAPLRSPVEATAYADLVSSLNGLLGGALDASSWDPLTCVQVGRLVSKADQYEALEVDGMALDARLEHAEVNWSPVGLPESATQASTASAATVWGAAPGDWSHFAEHLGLQADLLPVVSNPHSQVSPDSKLKAVGKVPSRYDSQHQVVGIAGWTQRQTTASAIAAWSKIPDYGICVQTRLVRAIDIDVDHPQALEIAAAVEEFLLVELPARRRGNSHKLLLALRCPGEMPKRRFPTEHGVVELLANGQQFIAVGTHPSGVRYEWDGGLPADIPEVTPELLDQLWRMLIERFGTDAGEERSSKGVEGPRRDTELDDVGSYLVATGRVLGDAPGKLYVACPREHEHTADSGITQAAWMLTGNGYERGHFNCQHAHAGHPPDDQEFLDSVGFIASQFEDLGPVEDEPDVGGEPTALDWMALPEVPEPIPFIVPGWMPDDVVTLLAAHGGTGKSYMSLYIGLCIALGRHPFQQGATIDRARVVLYSAEDNMRVIQVRVAAYLRVLGAQRADLVGWFEILDATKCANVLFSAGERGAGRTTNRFRWLQQRVRAFGARVLIFDNASDAMDANENDRAKVRQFLSALRDLAPAVLLLAHVDANSSMADPAQAKGYSGSTGWHNSARSRWFMARDPKTDKIVLALPKVNYAKAGSEAIIEWDDEFKVFRVVSAREGRVRATDVRGDLLALLKDVLDAGQQVSLAKNSANSVWNILHTMSGFPSGLNSAVVYTESQRWVSEGLVQEVEFKRGNRTKGKRLDMTEEGVRQASEARDLGVGDES